MPNACPGNRITREMAESAYVLRAAGYTWTEINERLGRTPQRTTSIRDAALRHAEQHGLDTNALRLGNRAQRRSTGAVRPRRSRLVPAGLTFGVEIEVVGIREAGAANALRRAGVECNAESYNHRTRQAWKVVYDASVPGGCEVVSPPLAFDDESFRIIRTVTKALTDAGATVNRSTGLHVHVGVRDLDRESIMRFAETYIDRQTAFDSLVASFRRRGQNSMTQHWTPARWTQVRGEFVAGANGWSGSDGRRYHTVNPFAFVRHGTLEFRQHQGTLSARKIESWVRTLFALRALATSEDRTGVSTSLGFLGDLAERGHLTTTAAAYMTARAERLAA